MTSMNKLRIFLVAIFATCAVVTGACLLYARSVEAATTSVPDVLGQLNAGSQAAGFGTEAVDPRIAVANGVKLFLSLLGIIFVCLVVYAGFLIFTAAGNDERVTQAKGIIITSVIGLVIIFSAYSITSFVTRRILAETVGSY